MALRVPMFFKFLTGCLVLATIIIVGGAVIVHKETKMKSRGPYLAKHFKRYLNYQEGLGNATATLGAVLADDDRLKAALTEAPVPEDGTPIANAPTLDRVAKSMGRALAGKKHIAPDVFVIVSKQKPHQRSWTPDKSPLALEDLENLPPVHKVLEGYPFSNKVFVHNGKAYQLAGAPVRAADDERVLGGVIIGIEMSRYMGQYQKQSDKKVAMQHRLTLLHGDVVAASVFAKDSWPELATKLKQEQFVTEGDFQRRITTLKAGEFDVYSEQVDGFADAQGRPPKLYILRSRSNLKGRGAVIPWMNIWIGAGLSVLIASLLALWITRPIKQFVRQSRDMLAGGANLKQRVELSTRDETRDLADNINQVFSRLFGLASEVQSAAFQVGASSAEISAASKQMLEGLRDQTFKIESSTAAVTELSASIQQVADNAAEATEAAQKSNVAVGSAVQTMQQIRSSVEAAAGKMSDLDESSKRIGNIVEVIRQISEQTSLLALNASIEAAHAGEQGRGFAVVADEVSSLAKRVGQSAKDIETLIQTIKEQTSDAVQSMEIGTREVEGGTQLVTTTLQDLQQLIHVVGDTAAAVLEQAQVSDEIARNMDAVQKIAAELVHGSEEAVQQGDQLHGLAFALEQSVGGFNVDESAATQTASRPALHE